MDTSQIIMSILGAAGFTSVGTALVLKIFLETGIKESIASVYKKQLEDHKFLLKNSEIVFKYKLDASKKLYEVLHSILPKRSHPDMDWDEACEEIASSFSRHENALDDFLCEYQATLSKEILTRVKNAISACSDGQFEFYWDATINHALPTNNAKDNANELYNALNEAVELLRIEVNDMVTKQSPERDKIMNNYNPKKYPKFIRITQEEVTLKFVFDNIRNIGISALVFAAGILISKGEPISSLLSIPYSQFVIGSLLVIGGFILAIMNFLQATLAIQAASKMGKLPYIFIALLINVATFEVFFKQVFKLIIN